MALFTTRPSTARHRATNPPSSPPTAPAGADRTCPRDAVARLVADLARDAADAQSAAIATLALLRTEDAPTIQWTLTDDAQVPPRLEGHIHPRTTAPDRYQRHALAAWQRVIGAGPITVDPARGGGERLTAIGSYEGIAVHVRTTIRGQR